MDPAQWVDVLAEAAPRFTQGVPLFSSALGDLFVWLGEHLHVLEFRSGTSRILTNSLDTFVVIAAYESFLQDPDYFDWAPWPEARELVGVPEADECLGFTPLLALGGRRSAETLQRVAMREHLLLIASLAGPSTEPGPVQTLRRSSGGAADDPVPALRRRGGGAANNY